MASSKKIRGKQRKIAKREAAAKSLRVIGGPDGPYIDEGQQDKCAVLVRQGDKYATEALAYADNNISLVRSGIASTILDFLKRCEHETFEEVVAGVGGNLVTPSSWIKVLFSDAALREEGGSLWLLIAQNIGPLVRCMCDDTKRLFYKSNKHWRSSIGPFVRLIHHMLLPYDCEDDIQIRRNIIKPLLQYEG